MKPKALLKQLEEQGNPIIADGVATFVWVGKKAPYLVGDFNSWAAWGDDPIAMQPVGERVWSHSIAFEPDAYIEYGFLYDATDPESRTPDPYNKKRLVDNGLGSKNHFFTMPDYVRSPYLKRRKATPQGILTRHTLRSSFVSTGQRTLWFYQPPADDPVPLLLVWDGQDYIEQARLPILLDNLIAEGKIQPIAVAFIASHSPSRFMEYCANDAWVLMALHRVVPLAHEYLNLLDVSAHEGAYGVLGASMGGLQALYTGLRAPHVFGKVISQSGAFRFQLDAEHPDITRYLVSQEDPALNIWMDVGRYEWLLQDNRDMHAALHAQGYEVSYRELSSGHTYRAWRQALPEALMTLFPPTAASE